MLQKIKSFKSIRAGHSLIFLLRQGFKKAEQVPSLSSTTNATTATTATAATSSQRMQQLQQLQQLSQQRPRLEVEIVSS